MWLLRIPGFFLAIFRAIIMIVLVVVMVSLYMIFSSFLFKHTPARAYKLRSLFISIATPFSGLRIEKEGEIHDQPALYVCNHRSFSDPLVVLRYLDAYVIAKAEVADIPFLNKGALITGIIYVKRESQDSRKATRKAMVDTIKSGHNVLVFPEGTTNDKFKTMPYRPGSFVEAARNNIPIVPVVLEYKTKWDMWMDRSLVGQFFFQFWKWSTPVKIKFGKPIQSDDFEYLRATAENITNDEIGKMHVGWDSIFSAEVTRQNTIQQG